MSNPLAHNLSEELNTLQKTLYFCDKCQKEVPIYKNGSIKPQLFSFTVKNHNNFKEFDKDGYGFELCSECAEMFAMLVIDFCKIGKKTTTYNEVSNTEN